MRHLLEFEIFESYLPPILDDDIIAATLVGEAGGEGKEGMIAVYNVLGNRAAKKSTSRAGEALRPKQFSMWNSATSDVSKKSDFDKNKVNKVIGIYKDGSEWKDAWKLANEIIKQDPKDITGGASHYYAHKKVSFPGWSGWTKTKVIGNHTFGKVLKY